MSVRDQMSADELFRLRGENKRRSRHKTGRKMQRSNLGIRLKARNSRPASMIKLWFESRFGRKKRFNPLPAQMRPSVPHRKRLIATGNLQEVSDYAKELRALCTPPQWQHIEALYFGRLAHG